MPDEQFRASEKVRVFLDGELIRGGLIIITINPREGVLCTLGGKVMKILEVVYDPSSGEADKVYLAEEVE